MTNILKDKKIIYGYDSDKDVIFIVRNKENKIEKLRIKDYKWYFFIKEIDFERSKEILKKYKRYIFAVRRDDVPGYLRIYCKRDLDFLKKIVSDFYKKNIESYEADVSMNRRYIIDNEVEFTEDIKIGYFDIETEGKSNINEIGKDKILCFTVLDRDSDEEYFCNDKDELKLIKNFIKISKKFNVLVGWNSDNFDIPYLVERAKLFGIDLKKELKDVMFLDIMMRYVKLFAPIMSILGLTGFSLNEMCRVFLKDRQKIEIDKKPYELDDNKLKEYNINDVRLIKEIDLKLNTTMLMKKEAVWTYSYMNRFYVGVLLDNFILKEARKNNIRLRTNYSYIISEDLVSKEDMKPVGGYVMEPLVGFYKNVRVFDFKSLYPTIMIAFNISYETINSDFREEGSKILNNLLKGRKIEEIEIEEWIEYIKENKKFKKDNYVMTPYFQLFSIEHDGIMKKILQNLLEQRKEWKAKMKIYKEGTAEFANARASQEVIKELTNSLYGINAFKGGRYYDRYIAESVTYTGQFFNKLASYIAKKHFGIKTLYSDTDSLFLEIDKDEDAFKFHDEINEYLRKYLNELFDLNLEKNFVDLEYEKKYLKFALLDKKKYVGRLVWSDGKEVDFIHTRGLEIIKKDTAKITNNFLKELLNMIFYKEDFEYKDIEEVIIKYRNMIYNFKDVSPEDFVITKKLSKPLDKYKANSPHIVVARNIRNKIFDIKIERKINWSERIKYVVVDFKNKIYKDYDSWDKKTYDKDYYWNTILLKPAERLLKVIFKDIDLNRYNIFNTKTLF